MSISESGFGTLVQLIGNDQEHTQNGGGHPWTVANGVQSTLLLFNSSTSPVILDVTVSANAGTQWHKAVKLTAYETAATDINDLIASQIEDDQGRKLPKSALEGEVSWFAASRGLVFGRLLQTHAGGRMARNFSCGSNIVLCGMQNIASIIFPQSMFQGASITPYTCLAYDPTACYG